MILWQEHEVETRAARAARRKLQEAEAVAIDEFNERRYGVTHGAPDWRRADQWGDLVNGDAERDEGR
jgi:hypothetical protein